MIGFLNEHSLGDHGASEASLNFFLLAAQELAREGTILFKDSHFFLTADFAREFNALSLPKDVRALIRELVFGERYYRCWRPERLSNDIDQYTCHEPVLALQDHSICEAAERKILDNGLEASLLSAEDSAFQDRYQISVSKDRTRQQIELRCLSSLSLVRRWVTEQRGYYDPASAVAPKDFQTILLKLPDRFRATSKIERRGFRRVFEEMETCRLYYVDEGHPGGSAHIEVFSAHGEHLGTADINTGELDGSARVNGRTLKL
ncbi:MAG: hypothetical protein AABO57_20115 [Acidobacteriota bacterium]